MMTSTLPTEDRPIRMAPDLAEEVEKLLEPLTGEDQEKGRDAVMQVYHSSVSGSFGTIVEAYRTAIEEAVTAP